MKLIIYSPGIWVIHRISTHAAATFQGLSSLVASCSHSTLWDQAIGALHRKVGFFQGSWLHIRVFTGYSPRDNYQLNPNIWLSYRQNPGEIRCSLYVLRVKPFSTEKIVLGTPRMDQAVAWFSYVRSCLQWSFTGVLWVCIEETLWPCG